MRGVLSSGSSWGGWSPIEVSTSVGPGQFQPRRSIGSAPARVDREDLVARRLQHATQVHRRVGEPTQQQAERRANAAAAQMAEQGVGFAGKPRGLEVIADRLRLAGLQAGLFARQQRRFGKEEAGVRGGIELAGERGRGNPVEVKRPVQITDPRAAAQAFEDQQVVLAVAQLWIVGRWLARRKRVRNSGLRKPVSTGLR